MVWCVVVGVVVVGLVVVVVLVQMIQPEHAVSVQGHAYMQLIGWQNT